MGETSRCILPPSHLENQDLNVINSLNKDENTNRADWTLIMSSLRKNAYLSALILIIFNLLYTDG